MSLVITLSGQEGEHYARQGMANVNSGLKKIGILNHELTLQSISKETVLPYLNLKYYDIERLQFVAAKLKENPQWKPSNNYTSQSIDPDLKKKFVLENRSHLICHYTHSGCFVPVKFHNLSLPPNFLLTFGSSFNLCNELKEVAGRAWFKKSRFRVTVTRQI